MSNRNATDSLLFNSTNAQLASNFGLIPAHPTLLGLPIEVRSIILEHFLIAPEPLVCEPPALAEGAEVLEDWLYDREASDEEEEDDDDDDEKDNEFDCPCVDCYAYPFRQGEDEPMREPDYRLPTVLERGQTRIRYWLFGNIVCNKESSEEKACAHPAILTTCRKIYDEGEDLLHLNTVVITYFAPYFGATRRSYVLGQESVKAVFERHPLCRQVKRWEIRIWCDSDEDADFNFFVDWYEIVKKDMLALQDLRTLESLHLITTLLKPYSGDLAEEGIDHSHVLYNAVRTIRSQKCLVLLDDNADHSLEVYRKKRHTIQEEIESDWQPRDAIDVHYKVFRLVEKILERSDRLTWESGGLVESYTTFSKTWSLASFGNILTLENALIDLSDAKTFVEYDDCFDAASKVLEMMTQYVEKARQRLDDQAARLHLVNAHVTSEREPFRRQVTHIAARRRIESERNWIREQREFLKQVQKDIDTMKRDYRLEDIKKEE